MGYYDNFPLHIHHIQSYITTVSTRQLQQRIIQLFGELNQLEFSFEEVSIPTVPNGTIIFEFGLAEVDSFSFIDEAEIREALTFLAKGNVRSLDFFCSIRYYKGIGEERTALKFDYYMLRAVFGKGTLEMQVFHERGPRYLSPDDLTVFIFRKVNKSPTRKILKESNPLMTKK